MNKTDEDIDLIEFLLLLWKGKWVILSFTILAALSGGSFSIIKSKFEVEKKPIYETELMYTIDTIPPINYNNQSYETHKVFSDYQKMFYKKEIFDNWKNLNNKSELSFENFTNTIDLRGITVLKKERNRLTILKTKDEGKYIYIRADSFSKINDIFNYSTFVSGELTSEYAKLTKKEYAIIFNKINELNDAYAKDPTENFIYKVMTLDGYLTSQLITIDDYLAKVKNGAKAVYIQRPTMPKNLNDKGNKDSYFKILIFTVIGSTIGIFFIFTANAIRKRKKLQS
jgi:hypothetical protein